MTRVLIVDDDPTIRQIVATLLKIEGFDVATAADGRMALQQVLDHAPDVVLSDVRMPHMNGYELLAAIRANPDLNRMRFIFLAGITDGDAATEQALSLADARLVKPFTRELLLGTLRSVVA
ncbi:MAG: response regulator [Pseudomonadota bacterium]